MQQTHQTLGTKQQCRQPTSQKLQLTQVEREAQLAQRIEVLEAQAKEQHPTEAAVEMMERWREQFMQVCDNASRRFWER
jgi:hypothetical protein